MAEILPEEAVKRLGLENLAQIPGQTASNGKYAFLGIDEIALHYKADIVKDESPLMVMAAKMLGTEGLPRAQRTTLTSSHLTGVVPSEATHYCLGVKMTHEEATRKNAFSYDTISIVFLRESK